MDNAFGSFLLSLLQSETIMSLESSDYLSGILINDRLANFWSLFRIGVRFYYSNKQINIGINTTIYCIYCTYIYAVALDMPPLPVGFRIVNATTTIHDRHRFNFLFIYINVIVHFKLLQKIY